MEDPKQSCQNLQLRLIQGDALDLQDTDDGLVILEGKEVVNTGAFAIGLRDAQVHAGGQDRVVFQGEPDPGGLRRLLLPRLKGQLEAIDAMARGAVVEVYVSTLH